jgi:hypothetical protein
LFRVTPHVVSRVAAPLNLSRQIYLRCTDPALIYVTSPTGALRRSMRPAFEQIGEAAGEAGLSIVAQIDGARVRNIAARIPRASAMGAVDRPGAFGLSVEITQLDGFPFQESLSAVYKCYQLEAQLRFDHGIG